MRSLTTAAATLMVLFLAVPLLAQVDFATSLHATRAGKSFWYDQGFKLLTGVNISELGCESCHGPTDADGNAYGAAYQPGCVDCHPTGNFSRSALREERCFGCHSRQAQEVDAGMPDVHRSAGLKCWDCHNATEIHGDGTPRNSMFESSGLSTNCSECHTDLPASHATYDPHNGKLHCSSCHTSTVISCYNCHFESQVEAGVKRPKQLISGFVLLVNRLKDGKVGTASFQSLTYQGKTFVAFGPYHGHTIVKAGRRCVDCHNNMGGQNEAISAYNAFGSIPFARWNPVDSLLEWMHGVIPMPFDYERTFTMDFLTYNGSSSDPVAASKNWSLVKSSTDGQHMLFATPLNSEQMHSLGFNTLAVRRLDGAAAAFALRQNHPNPFRSTTAIRYSIPHDADVKLSVYNALGREIKTLAVGRLSGGNYETIFDAAGLEPGLYFSRLRAGSSVQTRKMLLLR